MANQIKSAAVLADRMAVQFPIDVDGRRVLAIVSVECLQDHFGLGTGPSNEWTDAYRRNSSAIEAVAIRKARAGAPEPVLVSTGDF